MANELEKFDLNSLSMEDVKRLKNQAIERLKASGALPLMQTSHQNGSHSSHTNHSTHGNSGPGFISAP